MGKKIKILVHLVEPIAENTARVLEQMSNIETTMVTKDNLSAYLNKKEILLAYSESLKEFK